MFSERILLSSIYSNSMQCNLVAFIYRESHASRVMLRTTACFQACLHAMARPLVTLYTVHHRSRGLSKGPREIQAERRGRHREKHVIGVM